RPGPVPAAPRIVVFSREDTITSSQPAPTTTPVISLREGRALDTQLLGEQLAPTSTTANALPLHVEAFSMASADVSTDTQENVKATVPAASTQATHAETLDQPAPGVVVGQTVAIDAATTQVAVPAGNAAGPTSPTVTITTPQPVAAAELSATALPTIA